MQGEVDEAKGQGDELERSRSSLANLIPYPFIAKSGGAGARIKVRRRKDEDEYGHGDSDDDSGAVAAFFCFLLTPLLYLLL